MRGYLGREAADGSRSADPISDRPDGFLPILFLHIPRTGGLTLKTMLEAIYGQARSFSDAHLYETPEPDLNRFALIEGHLQSGYFAGRFGPSWSLNGMTMLREPVARVVSQARHLRALPQTTEHGSVKSTLRDPTAAFENAPSLRNLQTKLLAHRLSPRATVDEGALELAMAVLDQLPFGLTDRFDTSVSLFAERYELALPRFPNVNPSPEAGDPDLRSEEFRAAALAFNDLDVRLYQHAADLFERRVNRYVEMLMNLSLDEGCLEGSARPGPPGRPTDKVLPLEPGAATFTFDGWALVDGHPPDAVLARIGGLTTPLCCRVSLRGVAIRTRNISNRYSGYIGTVDIPPDAETLELIAFDRARGRSARHSFRLARPKVRGKRSTGLVRHGHRAMRYVRGLPQKRG